MPGISGKVFSPVGPDLAGRSRARSDPGRIARNRHLKTIIVEKKKRKKHVIGIRWRAFCRKLAKNTKDGATCVVSDDKRPSGAEPTGKGFPDTSKVYAR